MTRTLTRGPRRRRRAVGPSGPPTPDIELLAHVPYFASLGAAELHHLATRCAPRTLPPGAVLFEEGQACRGLFIVAEGAVEVRQVSLVDANRSFIPKGRGPR